MKNFKFDFDDWGSWGIGSWYDEAYDALKAAVESGQPFDTGWHGWKKELESMRIVRTEHETIVEVHSCMDEAFEGDSLIRDCLTEEEEEMLNDEKAEKIREYLYMGDFREETEDSEVLPLNSTIEGIEEAAEKLVGNCERTLNDYFRQCICVTLVVMYGESEETEKLIANRIAELAPEK